MKGHKDRGGGGWEHAYVNPNPGNFGPWEHRILELGNIGPCNYKTPFHGPMENMGALGTDG